MAPERRSLQPVCPIGVHEARCCGWIDLGTQVNRFAKGKDKKAARKVMLTFCVRGAAGETWRISREFTLSGGARSGLRHLLEEWRGRPYANDDEAWAAVRAPLRVLDQPALVRITHRAGEDGRQWPQIAGVWPPLKGRMVEPLRWPPVYFTLEEPDREVFQHLPPWVQTKIRASAEWGRMGRRNDQDQAQNGRG